MGTRGGSNGPRRAATLDEFSLLVGLECLPLSTIQPPTVNTEAAEYIHNQHIRVLYLRTSQSHSIVHMQQYLIGDRLQTGGVLLE